METRHRELATDAARIPSGRTGPTKDSPGTTEEEREYYSLSQRIYSVFAQVYNAVVFPFRSLRRDLEDTAGLSPGSRLLDVATGTGAQAFAFAGKVREVVGIDMSEAMLCVARRKNRTPNVTFLQADAADLPFEDESFDASCVSFALHEMPPSIRERVVRAMARVTKPGGAVIIVDYGLPRNRVASWLAYHIVKLYEPNRYASFVKADVAALLEGAWDRAVRSSSRAPRVREYHDRAQAAVRAPLVKAHTVVVVRPAARSPKCGR